MGSVTSCTESLGYDSDWLLRFGHWDLFEILPPSRLKSMRPFVHKVKRVEMNEGAGLLIRNLKDRLIGPKATYQTLRQASNHLFTVQIIRAVQVELRPRR